LVHLQYSLIADEGIRTTWCKAFKAGETACERLGANHLLLHGIWAFKANAPGERTDLILGTRLEITPEVESVAEAMALTEWKLVRSPRELESKTQMALAQARLYGTGSLAGFEIATRRYLVIVSEDRLQMPANVLDGAVEYCYRNIAVDPQSPSAAAKRI
jgi:hypothetical protein